MQSSSSEWLDEKSFRTSVTRASSAREALGWSDQRALGRWPGSDSFPSPEIAVKSRGCDVG